jgi:hypothetical protein
MKFAPGQSNRPTPAAEMLPGAAADAAFGRQAASFARQGGNGHGETG